MGCRMTKPTQSQWPVRPAKTQIRESSLSAWRNLRSLATNWAHSEDSDQTGRMPRLIWAFDGRTGHFVGLATHWAHSKDSDQTGRMLIWVFTGRICHSVGLATHWAHSEDSDQTGRISFCWFSYPLSAQVILLVYVYRTTIALTLRRLLCCIITLGSCSSTLFQVFRALKISDLNLLATGPPRYYCFYL